MISKLSSVIKNITLSPQGEEIWKACQLNEVIRFVRQNKLIILGGDVLLPDYEYSYSNWFYAPNIKKGWENNVELSIAKTRNFIAAYEKENGDSHFFTIVLSEWAEIIIRAYSDNSMT